MHACMPSLLFSTSIIHGADVFRASAGFPLEGLAEESCPVKIERELVT